MPYQTFAERAILRAVADHEPSKFGRFIQTYSAFLSSFVIGVAGLIATSIWQYRQSQIAVEQSHAEQAAAKAKADSDWRIARAEILGKNLNVLSAQGANTADQRFGVLLSLTRGNIIDPELAVSYALELGRDNADYMRSVLASTTDKNYWQLAQAFKLTCLQRFGVARAAEICKDDKLADRSDAIAQLFEDELEAATAASDVQHGPMSLLREERQVQEWPGKMAWLFEPYLQDLYERRLWKDIDHFESASVGARLVGALVLATARTGELVSSSEAARVEAFHTDHRKWLVSHLLGSDLRRRLPRAAGRRDAELVRRGAGRLRRAAQAPAAAAARRGGPDAGAPARAAALVPGRRRRSGAVPRPRAGAGGDPGAGAGSRSAAAVDPSSVDDLVGLTALVPEPTDPKTQPAWKALMSGDGAPAAGGGQGAAAANATSACSRPSARRRRASARIRRR